MKMKRSTLTILATLVCASAFMAGCGGTDPVMVSSVAVAPKTLTLQIGGSQKLTATVVPTDADNAGVVWASSNSAVATVSAAGEVTAVAEGTADITATAADGSAKSGKCTVTVLATPEVAITSTQNLTDVNEFKYSTMVDGEGKPAQDIRIEIAATRGIGSLKVIIATERAEINEALAGMGLTDKFDLVTMPKEQADALNQIFGGGIPTGDAAKAKNVTIDLSAIPLFMLNLAGGVERFYVAVEVTDAASDLYPDVAPINKSATIKMKFIDDVTIPQVAITSSKSLTEENEFKYSTMVDGEGNSTEDISIDIASVRGIGSLKVKITTDSDLINGALAQLGLAEPFDLVTLPDEQASALNGLFGGIPTGDAAKGKSVTLNLSAIPKFISQIPGGVGQFDVAVEVTDAASDLYPDVAPITKAETLEMKFADDTTKTE